MSETSAAKLTAHLTDSAEETSVEDTDTTLEEVEGQEDEVVEEATETEEDSAEEEETELPDAVKEILRKNRKAVREAEARAVAAEKALADKDKAPAEETTEAPVDDKFKTLFINTAAKAALAEAGLSTGTDRMLKLLDLSSVDVDDSGTISGLDDQIKDLKADFADLFAPKPTKKPVVKSDGAGRREVPSVPKTSAQLLAERVGR